MGKRIFYTAFFIVFVVSTFGQNSKNENSLIVSTNIGLENIDSTYLKDDIFESRENNSLPLNSYNYPRTSYKGSAGIVEFQFEDINFAGATFYIGNENKFKKLFSKHKSNSYQDFFTILCYSANSNVMTERISSRNFPNYYIGQGMMNTPNCKITYFTFIDFSGNTYAIINEKVFDLKKGKTVILIPSRDGSLEFIQVKTSYLNMEGVKEYYGNLLKEQNITSLIEKVNK